MVKRPAGVLKSQFQLYRTVVAAHYIGVYACLGNVVAQTV